MDIEEYERKGQTAYASFAKTVAAVLTAAINNEKSYRLQQVKNRAKQSTSLRKKLENRDIVSTTAIENDIKDLAGCRVIFYTNTDVTRFIKSGIIEQNFEVIATKHHYPQREVEEAAEFYISYHYLVRLQLGRITLPEYAQFADMQCEIQIQTILNHAWAEMAHDTIYKSPALGNFGGQEFDGIKKRMQMVARKYLLPAGHEFQKIAQDFQRLIEGKALFDDDALETIIQAVDNNIRAEALEKFAEYVLPFYDDLQAIYPEVIAKLIQAAGRARETPPATINTPYGSFPGKTYCDISKSITDILTRYRYLDIVATFDALCKLYSWSDNGAEQRHLLELGKELSKHHLRIWRQQGPIVQIKLVEHIETLSDEIRHSLQPLLTMMLCEILGAEVNGTTNSSTAVTFHRGSVVASDLLRVVREKAINLLKSQFSLVENEKEHRSILLALQAATNLPTTGYSNELAQLVMDNTRTVIEFQTEIVSRLSLQLLQTTESQVHRCYQKFITLPETMRNDPDLVTASAQVTAAAQAFRITANNNPDFVIFKILIGYNSVFPAAWEDNEFRYKQAEIYRANEVQSLLASIDVENSDSWFDRINHYASIAPDDAAIFPTFSNFLEQLSEAQPAIAFNYIEKMNGPLVNFLPSMIAGLMKSTKRKQATTQIDTWLHAGTYIRQIAWYLQFAEPFDETILLQTLNSATEHDDIHAVCNVLIAAVSQFKDHPGTLIKKIFLPALHYLNTAGELSWVHMQYFSWLDKPIIQALNKEQANIVLHALIPYPKLEYNAEYIVATIAKRWPESVLDFIGKRQIFTQKDTAPSHYDTLPFKVHQLQHPLAAAPDIMLAKARNWFNDDPLHFPHVGGKLLASVFPDLSNPLETRLTEAIANGNDQDLDFVLGVLSAFEGKPPVYKLVRKIIAVLKPESPLLRKAQSVLRESGSVSGEFGYAELHTERKKILEEWLSDQNKAVQKFAAEEITELSKQIAADTRSAEASIALRKLEYDEDLNDV